MDITTSEQTKSTTSTILFSALLLGGFCLLQIFSIIFYRLFWSPVAGFPGPKLAAATFWYEFYYDVFRGGQYTWKIKFLHKQYGPVVRINPYELHIDDPDFYDSVYVSTATRATDKWWWSADMFNAPGSVLSTVPHGLHRRRRAGLANHFSIAAVQRLEPLLHEKTEKLLQRLQEASRSDKPLNLTHAFVALTVDVITTYTFAESWNYLDAEDFSPAFLYWFHSTGIVSHVNKQFPWLFSLVSYLPERLSNLLFPGQSLLINQQKGFRRQVEKEKAKKAPAKDSSTVNSEDLSNTHSIFASMLDAHVPESEKSTKRLVSEAQLLVVAGAMTTAHALETISWHLLANPPVLARLKEELSSVSAKESVDVKELSLRNLETLPYLTAVIREGLRLSYGVPHRLQRVSQDQILRYHNFTIPRGTPVSMSALMMHENEDIFPNALTFKPDRWFPLETTGQKLNRYLVPFSKGSRQCLGMNLAWSELYITIAAMYGGYTKIEIFDTNFERDIKTVIDGFNPLPSHDSRGLRVTVSG